MNNSFRSTDIYLTTLESIFCPLFFFLTKKIWWPWKKFFYLENEAIFEHFAENITHRRQNVKINLFCKVLIKMLCFGVIRVLIQWHFFPERRMYNILVMPVTCHIVSSLEACFLVIYYGGKKKSCLYLVRCVINLIMTLVALPSKCTLLKYIVWMILFWIVNF